MNETKYTNYDLLICKNWPFGSKPLEPAETRPRSNLRELLFQGTISKPKHQRNVFMAGTEYFGETAQPRDHIPINTMRKSHNRTLSRH